MTVIAAAIDKDGTIWMGADGVCSFADDDNVIPVTSSKVRRIGPFLVGCTGNVRVTQIAHFMFKPPAPKAGEDLLAFMVTKFTRALRKCMKGEGGETKDEEEGETVNGRFLVGVGGMLFEVDSAYGVIDTSRPYHAVGCAAQVAMGAMHGYNCASGEARHGRSMVEAALEASAELDINIRRPFTVESLPAMKPKRKR